MTPAGEAPIGRARLVLSCAAFTLLLAAYYVLRPLRDSLVAGQGAATIKYLSSTVFLVMLVIAPLFGWLVPQLPRSRLVPGLYALFVANLVGFAFAFAGPPSALAARVFYVWVTVFNLFAVSVFWSRMADVWTIAGARRSFGVIAAGGSLGGLVGPLLAGALATSLGPGALVGVAAVLLAVAAVLVALVPATAPAVVADPVSPPTRGASAALAGFGLILRTPFLAGIALVVALGSLAGMFVYIEMARLAALAYPDAGARTAFFSGRDLIVNGISALLQLLIVGRVTAWLGVQGALAGAGAIVMLAFAGLGLDPTLAMLTVASVVLRCTEFGLAKPARDMLYTVVGPDARYQAKNVIDTTIYRGSDMTAGWLHALLGRLGMTLPGYAWVGAALAAVITVAGVGLGRGYRRRGGS